MATTTIEYRMLPGTRASIGRAGTHSVIADRPDGKAGGMGLGFNGGELLALSLGGCLCNDIQLLADEMGLEVANLRVTASIDFDGNPTRAIGASIDIYCELADGCDPSALIERAKAFSAIANSVRDGLPVTISSAS